ncbi:MAG: hypothetical protein BZ138_07935 [Methanosphaera sp. rholeuAM270]|nr:MAG: hypothetical protein BZ138_07935 [Methanosphaera sp. rholeuAM270]
MATNSEAETGSSGSGMTEEVQETVNKFSNSDVAYGYSMGIPAPLNYDFQDRYGEDWLEGAMEEYITTVIGNNKEIMEDLVKDENENIGRDDYIEEMDSSFGESLHGTNQAQRDFFDWMEKNTH